MSRYSQDTIQLVRDFLNSIGTNFNLSDEQVVRRIAAARKVLRESEDFQGSIKYTR